MIHFVKKKIVVAINNDSKTIGSICAVSTLFGKKSVLGYKHIWYYNNYSHKIVTTEKWCETNAGAYYPKNELLVVFIIAVALCSTRKKKVFNLCAVGNRLCRNIEN